MNHAEEIAKLCCGTKRVLLQLPDGLKMKALEIAIELEIHGIECVISLDACYGACDLRISEAELAGCDLIMHIGHSDFGISSPVPVIYYEWPIDVDIDEKEIKKIAEHRIGLLTTVQHTGCLEKIAGKIRKAGKTAVIGGPILGCSHENADKMSTDVDTFLFVGSGAFHALGLKKAYRLDVEKGIVIDMEAELLREGKKRQARLAKFMDAETIGIIVSAKPGQFNIKTAYEIKKHLEEKDKKAFVLIMDEINDSMLLSVPADAFVNTACPRITDNAFSKTVINAGDLNDRSTGK